MGAEVEAGAGAEAAEEVEARAGAAEEPVVVVPAAAVAEVVAAVVEVVEEAVVEEAVIRQCRGDGRPGPVRPRHHPSRTSTIGVPRWGRCPIRRSGSARQLPRSSAPSYSSTPRRLRRRGSDQPERRPRRVPELRVTAGLIVIEKLGSPVNV